MPEMTVSSQPSNVSWVPSLTDLVFVSALAWLLLSGIGTKSLLNDGDTGWHIRTGEYILANHTLPTHDLFSFTKSSEPWYAWEWLSDVLFAIVHKAGALPGIVLLAGTLIAATAAIVFRFMMWKGANLVVAMLLLPLTTSVASIHYLARPHLFTYLFVPIAIWLLEWDRRKQTPWLFALVGLSMLWTNLHGGFVGLLAVISIYLAGNIAETLCLPRESRRWERAKRYGLLLGLSAAVTFVNPYFYHLHVHIVQFLRSDFILNHNTEFAPPYFRGEAMKYFEVMLFAGLVTIPVLVKRRDMTSALLVLFWAHAALLSVRHVALYVVVTAPIVASELSALWEIGAQRGIGWLQTLSEVAKDYGSGHFGAGRRRAMGWLTPASVVALGLILFKGQGRERLRVEFPKDQFPVAACRAERAELAGRRIFTSDQWADYLIYLYYPNFKAFIDGRSDFYGPELGQEYIALMHSEYRWAQIFDRYDFDLAIVPAEWPLATTLKMQPGWKLKYDDGKALVLERTVPGLEKNAQEKLASRRDLKPAPPQS